MGRVVVACARTLTPRQPTRAKGTRARRRPDPVGEPAGVLVTCEDRVEPPVSKQPPEEVPVLGRPSVLLGVGEQSVCGVPTSRSGVQLGVELRVPLPEQRAEQRREQGVVAVDARALDLGEEDATSLELLESSAGVRIVGEDAPRARA